MFSSSVMLPQIISPFTQIVGITSKKQLTKHASLNLLPNDLTEMGLQNHLCFSDFERKNNQRLFF